MNITLSSNSIPNEDIQDLSSWLLTYPRLSSGPLVLEFERKFADQVGSKHSIILNSGSSANILMLYALKTMGKLKNEKIVVPTLAWATTLSPVIQLGMEPILCDINLENLSVDLEDLETIFEETSPSCLILVSILGMLPNYDAICALCTKYDVILIEDACESLGSMKGEKYAGTFGSMGSYSFFYSHQMCCIEGGAIVTDDDEIYQNLLMLREHGWTRKCDEKTQTELKNKWNVSDFNDMYTFYVPGFNFRSTEINAFLGIKQLNRFDHIKNTRFNNYKMFNSKVKNPYWMPPSEENSLVSNLGYPIISPNRDKIAAALIAGGVECRPLVSGSMGNQPMYVKEYGVKPMHNGDMLDMFGMYVPNHPELTEEEITYMANIINENI